jgi:GT2 family glycosyltransferase
MISISIVIVTWNSQGVLENCVSSLFSHVPAGDFELLLVDNNSRDNAYLGAYENRPHIRVIRNAENLGFAKAVNIGFREASGNYFLILNPDMVFRSNPFPRLIEELRKDPEIGVIGPLLHGVDGKPQIQDFYPDFPGVLRLLFDFNILENLPLVQGLARRFLCARIGVSGVYFIDQIPGAFLFFRSDLFGDGPVLSESFFIWMEDVDFCLRIHRKGLKVAVVADEKITHVGGTSFKMWDVPHKRLKFTQSYLTYLRLNHSAGGYFLHSALMILNALSTFFLYPVYLKKKGLRTVGERLLAEIKVIILIVHNAAAYLRFRLTGK